MKHAQLLDAANLNQWTLDSEELCDEIEMSQTTGCNEFESADGVESRDVIQTENSCFVCRDGNYPSGSHSCIECGKYVHTVDGCSFSVDGSEGFGSKSKRICIECNSRKTKSKQSAKTTQALNTVDSWKPNRKKSSYYLKPNPQFDLINVDKKQCIGMLKNGNLFKKPQRLGGKSIVLTNTCTCDSLLQAIAGAYAYYPPYRLYAEQQQNDVFELAIHLAKKYVLMELFLIYL